MKNLIGIVDYECCNLKSLSNIIKNLGYQTFISNSPDELKKSDLIILPGIGSFAFAVKKLKEYNLMNFLKKINKKKPLIGICLGMQLFADKGYERGINKGLGIIPGEVKKISEDDYNIGWRKITTNTKKKIKYQFEKNYFYFNHGYHFKTKEKFIIMKSNLNSFSFASVVQKKNVVGFQFHPEKSQLSGKLILKETIKMLLND